MMTTPETGLARSGMPPMSWQRRWQGLLLGNLALAVLYVLFARLGLLFALVNSSVSLIWPPAGVALAALVLWGWRVVPGVAVGAFVANGMGGESLVFALATAAGNAGEALLGAQMLKHLLGFSPRLDREGDVLGLPVCSAACAVFAATIGAGTLWLTGKVSPGSFGATWFHWWLGDTLGMAVLAPVALTLGVYGLPGRLEWRSALEALILMAVVFAGGLVLFGAAFPTWPALSILVIPVLMIVAFRFSIREVTFANMLVAVGAILGASKAFGHSQPDVLARGLLTLSILLMVSSLATQLLAAILAQWKATEQALRERERKYRELVEHANSIILHWDSEGRVNFLNEYGLRFFGFADSEIVGGPLVGTIVPETESTGRDMHRLMEQISSDPKSFEHNINENVRKSGERVWIEWTNKVALDEKGRVQGILSIGTDITERRRAERALLESEIRYRGLFEDCPTSLWEEDFSAVRSHIDEIRLSGVRDLGAYFDEHPEALRHCAALVKVLDVNKATLDLLGYERREDLCAHLSQIFRPDSYALFRDELVSLTSGEKVFQTETVNRGRDGEAVHVNMSVAIVPGHEHNWSRVFVALTDISSRIRAEEELRLLNDMLERRVEERTAELAAAKERAEAADKVKSAFLAAMSHELRTPLNSIIGFTGIILQELAGPLNPEQKKQLLMVQGSARHLLALINDVLDLSKIEAGQLEVEMALFDARESIARAVQLVGPLAEKKGLALSVDVSPDVGELLNDRRRFEQIVINLANNALKFTDTGGVHVECGLEGGELVMRISDTGIGIKPEDVGKLFQAFHQIDVGLTRNHEGTGLGLSICKRLVEKMGGRIWVKSEWGVGSVFSFALPLGQQQE